MRGFVIIASGAIVIAALPIAPVAGQSVERDQGASAWASPSWGPSTSVRIHRGHDARSDFGHRAHHYDGAAYFPYREYQGDTLWGQTASTIGGTTDRIAPFHGGSVTIKIANVGGGQAATGVVDFERRIDRAS